MARGERSRVSTPIAGAAAGSVAVALAVYVAFTPRNGELPSAERPAAPSVGLSADDEATRLAARPDESTQPPATAQDAAGPTVKTARQAPPPAFRPEPGTAPASTPDTSSPDTSSPDTAARETAALETADPGALRERAVDPSTAQDGDTDPSAPRFDLVRADADGSVLLAGTAEPADTIRIEVDGVEAAETRADDAGSFVAFLDLPVDGKARVIDLIAVGADGRERRAEDSVVLAPRAPEAPPALAEEGLSGDVEPDVEVARDTADDEVRMSRVPERIARDPAERATADQAGRAASAVNGATVEADANPAAPSDATVAARPGGAEVAIAQQPPDRAGREEVEPLARADGPEGRAAPDVSALGTGQARAPVSAETASPLGIAGPESGAPARRATSAERDDATAPPDDGATASPAAGAAVPAPAGQPSPAEGAAPTLARQGTAPPADAAAPPAGSVAQAPAVLMAGAQGVRLASPGGGQRERLDRVVVDVISYAADGAVLLEGRSAPPPPPVDSVRVYLDNAVVDSAPIADDGTWRLPLSDVEQGIYTLRVDQLDPSGQVVSRFETPFRREDPVALARLESAAATVPSGQFEASVITVQPGYTLWGIATDRYGSGFEYVHIFRANDDQIRDPDLIYPGQVFDLPDLEDAD